MKVQSGYQDHLISDFQKLIGVSVNTLTDYGISSNTGFCRGSASVPRELILSTQVNASLHGGGLSASCMNTGLGDEAHALDIFREKNCGTHSQLDMV